MTTIERNVMIITEGSEEQMQGIIRGIEALDTEHKIGIIYGTANSTATTEVEMILADLAKALIIKTAGVDIVEPPQGKDTTPYMDINVPDGDRETVINYIQKEYPTLIGDILKK